MNSRDKMIIRQVIAKVNAVHDKLASKGDIYPSTMDEIEVFRSVLEVMCEKNKINCDSYNVTIKDIIDPLEEIKDAISISEDISTNDRHILILGLTYIVNALNLELV